MDLNFLYARHQLGVMHAGRAASGPARSLHLACARRAAGDILTYQLSMGTPAAAGWQRGIAEPGLRAATQARPAR